MTLLSVFHDDNTAMTYDILHTQLINQATQERKLAILRWHRQQPLPHPIGIAHAIIDATVKQYKEDLPYVVWQQLWLSQWHEERMIAVKWLAARMSRKKWTLPPTWPAYQLLFFMTQHLSQLDQWDLIDTFAPKVLGPFCLAYQRTHWLFTLIEQPTWASQRLAMVASMAYIKAGQVDIVFRLAKQLLHSEHDLVKKSIGWMLKEASEFYFESVLGFIQQYKDQLKSGIIPYATEKWTPEQKALIKPS